MKKLFVLSALFLMMASAYGQEKVIDSTLAKKGYTKTEQTVKIEDITYFVYRYKTGEYFTIRENKKTGRKYWQPLEKSNVTAKNENHQKQQ
ncbi:hypothetical protein [Maribacter sp. 2307ULW6-5]|uniref:hypothetical protein n=1 Tax=Maribacter sp. 2307ULW6-5 TaxID=3386275 RepID=UPI0039BCAE91